MLMFTKINIWSRRTSIDTLNVYETLRINLWYAIIEYQIQQPDKRRHFSRKFTRRSISNLDELIKRDCK